MYRGITPLGSHQQLVLIAAVDVGLEGGLLAQVLKLFAWMPVDANLLDVNIGIECLKRIGPFAFQCRIEAPELSQVHSVPFLQLFSQLFSYP